MPAVSQYVNGGSQGSCVTEQRSSFVDPLPVMANLAVSWAKDSKKFIYPTIDGDASVAKEFHAVSHMLVKRSHSSEPDFVAFEPGVLGKMPSKRFTVFNGGIQIFR
jgi:hypothetical protein